MPKSYHLLLLLVLLPILILIAAPPSAHHIASAQSSATVTSTQPIVAPLEPITVTVSVPDYSGPVSLVIFDSRSQAVGAWEFFMVGGFHTLEVIPRGALGLHHAIIFVNGEPLAHVPIYTLEAETSLATGDPTLDSLYGLVRELMRGAELGYWLDGHYVYGYRSPDSPLLWLRDHYYQGRGFRYFDTDVTSLLDAFRRAQYADGSFPDFLEHPLHHIPAARTEVEADVEYLFVLSVYDAWKMTGDDAWLIENLDAMQRALAYTLTDPLRWEPSLGLVKRPFTIDTWDFEYGPTTQHPITGEPSPRHWIDDETKWGIFHGDNTGLIQALRALAEIETYLGQWENAYGRLLLADAITARLNALSWNGSFYTHHVKLEPWQAPGVDESRQLSLSNAMALNRGVLSVEQGRAILNEYRQRFRNPYNISFAEWWSIDPPFPDGSFGLANRLGERPGEYVNGGIMPLVGGELSRGAFRYGEEAYGFDILRRYHTLVSTTNASYLWYYPTGGVGIGSDDTLETDGWGASAMLGALMEGAAGVEDDGVRYSAVTLSPRWVADNKTSAAVVARYPASDGYVAYRWQWLPAERPTQTRIVFQATGSGSTMRLRLLLPPATKAVRDIILNGQPVEGTLEQIGDSTYLVITAAGPIVELQTTLEHHYIVTPGQPGPF